MSNQQDSSSKGWIIIITSVIGVLGTIAVAYFAFRGAVFPKQLEIEATQTAQSIQSTQMANDIWITQTAQSIEVTRFAESIKATQTSVALNSNSTTSQSVQATHTPLLTAVPPTAYIAPPPTPAPIVITNNIHIEKCCGIDGTQRSDPIDFTISIRTVDFLQIEYSQIKGCSDAFFHILLDDVPVYTTEHFGPISGNYTTGLIDLSPYISQGRHNLKLSPEGVVGGCNSGALGSWGGDLIIHTNEYP